MTKTGKVATVVKAAGAAGVGNYSLAARRLATVSPGATRAGFYGTGAALAVLLVAPFIMLLLLSGTASGSGGGRAVIAEEQARKENFIPPNIGRPGDIPAHVWGFYEQAAAEVAQHVPGCVIDAYILAGIAEIETHQGTYGGASVDENGDVVPPIIGIALDGSAGVAAIPDTDGGALDGDSVWDRAVGPFQFIPSSWAQYTRGGSPHNMKDAAVAAGIHLCTSHATDLINNEGALSNALFDYNHSAKYVADVMAAISSFRDAAEAFQLADDCTSCVGQYALPFPKTSTTSGALSRPHHDYPAFDLAIPVGTPLYAVTGGTISQAFADSGACGGTVVIAGDDGVTYIYCHLSNVEVNSGDRVVPGRAVGLSGGQPGAPGAGNTTGPHLHFAMKVNGQNRCPQAFLTGIWVGQLIDPKDTASGGCIS